MRRRVVVAGLIIALVLVIPLSARADHEEKNVRLRGVVVSLNARDGSFVLRDLRHGEREWFVILHAEVDIDAAGKGDKRRHVLVGDIVEVEGEILTRQTVLARKVKIEAHSSGAAPSVRQPAPARPDTLGAVIKVIGIGAAVHTFGPAINSFINNLLQARDAATQQTTKVVPIVSVSIGINAPGRATIGAAQVAGPRSQVQRVQAVAAIDANFQDVWQVRAFVPVDSLEPWRRFRRVVGVGVSAIIDVRL